MELIKFESDIQMYNKIDELISIGYKIIDGINHSIILQKENNKILLTFQNINNEDNCLEELKSKSHVLPYKKPDYSRCILNVIASIRDNFGYCSKYNKLDIIDKKYDNIIILLIDGLGMNILNNNFSDDSFLKKHCAKTINAIFPSTTAAATTSTICGLPPIESSWTGWENYFKEYNRDLVLFTGIDYYTNETTGINPSQIIPFKPFFYDMKEKGIVIQPDFSIHPIDFSYVLNKSIEAQDNYQIQYVYHPAPDGIMHLTGSYSINTKLECKAIDKMIEEYSTKLKENTLLIVTADHGHTNVTPLSLYENKQIMNLLERNPSNDARCIAFKVKQGNEKEFERLFNIYYGDSYLLKNSKIAIEEGYFGPLNSIKNPRAIEFLADYVAIAIGNYYFNYNGTNILFKSHHAGITLDELEIPLILFSK